MSSRVGKLFAYDLRKSFAHSVLSVGVTAHFGFGTVLATLLDVVPTLARG